VSGFANEEIGAIFYYGLYIYKQVFYNFELVFYVFFQIDKTLICYVKFRNLFTESVRPRKGTPSKVIGHAP